MSGIDRLLAVMRRCATGARLPVGHRPDLRLDRALHHRGGLRGRRRDRARRHGGAARKSWATCCCRSSTTPRWRARPAVRLRRRGRRRSPTRWSTATRTSSATQVSGSAEPQTIWEERKAAERARRPAATAACWRTCRSRFPRYCAPEDAEARRPGRLRLGPCPADPGQAARGDRGAGGGARRRRAATEQELELGDLLFTVRQSRPPPGARPRGGLARDQRQVRAPLPQHRGGSGETRAERWPR